MIMSHYILQFDPFLRVGIQKYFRSFFGSNENFKIYFRDLLTFKLDRCIRKTEN